MPITTQGGNTVDVPEGSPLIKESKIPKPPTVQPDVTSNVRPGFTSSGQFDSAYLGTKPAVTTNTTNSNGKLDAANKPLSPDSSKIIREFLLREASLNHYGIVSNEYADIKQFRSPVNNPVITGYNYIFLTSPDLPISVHNLAMRLSAISNTGKDVSGKTLRVNQNLLKLPREGSTNYKEYSIYSPDIIDSLAGKSNFINLLSNRASKFNAISETLDTEDYSEVYSKYKILIGTTSKDSRIAGQLSIDYLEDDNLNIIKLHRLWMDYIEKAFFGDCLNSNRIYELVWPNSNIVPPYQLDYASSLYHFAVKPDGETLYYWAKYTGIIPSSLPYDMFSSEDSNSEVKQSVTIEYKFSYKEDMDIDILADFNKVCCMGLPTVDLSETLYPNDNSYEYGAISDTDSKFNLYHKEAKDAKFYIDVHTPKDGDMGGTNNDIPIFKLKFNEKKDT
jgi:hypothetical protein